MIGESHSFNGNKGYLARNKVKVIDLDLKECRQLMKEFIAKKPGLWKEDIGE